VVSASMNRNKTAKSVAVPKSRWITRSTPTSAVISSVGRMEAAMETFGRI